jgi:hypothetical protein
MYSIAVTAIFGAATAMAACSLRPLPGEIETFDGKERLPIYEIVHRIECEAATAVRDAHGLRNLTRLSDDLEALSKRVGSAKKVVAAARLKLAETSDVGTREDEIRDAISANLLRGAQIQQARARAPKAGAESTPALDAEEKRTIEQGLKIAETWRLFKEVVRLNTVYEDLRSEMSAKKFGEVSSFEAHTAAFNFEFEITEDNNLSSTGSVTWPAVLGALPGAFTMGYDVGDKRQRLAKRTVKFATTFGELVSSFDTGRGGNKLSCSNVDVPPKDIAPRSYPITGSVGLAIVFKEYLAMLKSGKFKSGGEAYTDKIQFTTTINGALKPSIDLAGKPGPSLKISGAVEGIRKDIHSLTVSLGPSDEGDKAESTQQVIITQMPAVRVRPDVLRMPPLN